MKNLSSLLIAVILVFSGAVGLMLVHPQPVSATTYQVDGDGGADYTTIQAAVNAASEYDTIIVHETATEPDYEENVNVGVNHLAIREADGEDITVRAASMSDYVFEVTADYVTIQGFTVTRARDALKAGIYLASGTDHCTISNNNATDNYYGIYLSSSNNNTISSNTVSSNWEHGIMVSGESSNNTISSNTVNSNMRCGIVVYQSSNNTVSSNTANSNGEYGFGMTFASSNTISGNTANSNSEYGIYLFSSNTNTIYLNNFSGNTSANVGSDSTNVWKSPTTLCYFYSPSHKSYLGNYYSDHTFTDSNGDGITDSAYDLPGTEPNDEYPLVATSGNYTVQVWYLHSDSKMYEADMNKAPGSVTIATSGSNIWIADMAAENDITFPNGTWTGQVVFTSAPANGHTFSVEIGYSTDGSDFTGGGPDADVTGNGSSMAFTYTSNAASFTVPNGKYLALRITSNESIYSVTTGGAWSYTSNPNTGAPEYPIPELPIIVLLSIGLMVLGVYVWLQRRKSLFC